MSPRGWVLVTDDGDSQSRTALVAARALAAGGYAVAATVSGPRSLVGASRACARAVLMPPVSDPSFDERLRAETSAHPYLCVVPTSDVALVKLEPGIAGLLDKRELARRCREAGIATPPGRELPDVAALMAAADELGYPVVLKPSTTRWRPYSVESAAALRGNPPPDGPLLVQPFLSGRLRAVAGVMWRGEMVAAVHQGYVRTWPPGCGGASSAVSEAPDAALEEKLAALLGERDGIFMAQLVDDYLLDLNPRVYGSLPLAVAAGANLPALWCDLLDGRPVSRVRGRPGVRFRWLEGDVRNLYSRARGREVGLGSAARALAPRRGTAHPVESLRDPGPFLARLAYSLRRDRG